MHGCRLWEEAGVPGENPHRHRKNMQIRQKKVQDGRWIWTRDRLPVSKQCSPHFEFQPFVTGRNSPAPLHNSVEPSCKSGKRRMEEWCTYFSLLRALYFFFFVFFFFFYYILIWGIPAPTCCFLIKDCNFVLVWVIVYIAERIKRGGRKQERNMSHIRPKGRQFSLLKCVNGSSVISVKPQNDHLKICSSSSSHFSVGVTLFCFYSLWLTVC